MTRRALGRAAATVLGAAIIAGCTFLIDFEEVPAQDAGADTKPSQLPDVVVVADAGTDARDAADPGFVTACKTKVDGKYCPGNQIVWPGDNDDLITCRDGGVANVRFCESGSGCIRMRNGAPDQCDECAKKDAGVYCGRDMPGWDTANANVRVRCQNGAQIELMPCANGCLSNGASSSCK